MDSSASNVKKFFFAVAVSFLLFSIGCGALQPGPVGQPFGSAAEATAFEKAVAADAFPRANEALIAGLADR